MLRPSAITLPSTAGAARRPFASAARSGIVLGAQLGAAERRRRGQRPRIAPARITATRSASVCASSMKSSSGSRLAEQAERTDRRPGVRRAADIEAGRGLSRNQQLGLADVRQREIESGVAARRTSRLPACRAWRRARTISNQPRRPRGGARSSAHTSRSARRPSGSSGCRGLEHDPRFARAPRRANVRGINDADTAGTAARRSREKREVAL